MRLIDYPMSLKQWENGTLNFFPKIFSTLPATTCTFERNFLTLIRRLKTYLRNPCGQEC